MAPSGVDKGTALAIPVRAGDGAASFARDVEIQVDNVNQAPRIPVLPPRLAREGETLAFSVVAADADNDSVQLRLVDADQAPAGVSFDSASGYFEWTPGADVVDNSLADSRVFDFVFEARDGTGAGALASTRSVQVRVLDVNRVPSLLAGNHAVALGQSLDLPVNLGSGTGIQANDPDGAAQTQALTLSFANLPEGARYDAQTGRLAWTPGPGQIGDHNVIARVSDGRDGTQAVFTLRVVADTQAHAPRISIDTTPSTPVLPGQSVVATVRAEAWSGIASVGAETRQAGGAWQAVALDSAGRIRLAPSQPGIIELRVSASDVDGFSATRTHTLLVRNPADTRAPGLAWSGALAGAHTGGPAFALGQATALAARLDEAQLMGWRLEMARATASGEAAAWTPLARADTGATAVAGNLDLTSLDPRLYANGVYALRLTAWDLAGRVGEIGANLVIDSADKAAGLPLQSDARVRLAGHDLALARQWLGATGTAAGNNDLGDWRLPLLDSRLSSDQTETLDTGASAPWSEGARVWLDLPANLADPNAGLIDLRFTLATQSVALGSAPDAPTRLQPVFGADRGWRLQAHAAAPQDLTGDSAPDSLARQGTRLYDAGTGLPWVPAAYTLTAPDGTRYRLDGQGRVQGVAFADGAQWLVSDAGIAAVTGDPAERIDFLRDSQGRIVRVTLPPAPSGAGGEATGLAYGYDAQGRLMLARALNDANLGTPIPLDAGGTPYLGALAGNLGAIVAWNGQGNAWQGNLAAGQTAHLAYTVRDSEITSTARVPGDRGAVLLALESQLPAGATLEVDGAQIIASTTLNGVTTQVLRVSESGVKLIRLQGAGTARVKLGLAGDLNLDGRVDGADSALWEAAQAKAERSADLDGNGAIDAADRQLLYANAGFRANRAPEAGATPPTLKTHADLGVATALADIAQDLEGDALFWRVLGATHGDARLSADGQSLVFTPEAGYTGAATIRVQADDGFAAGPVVELGVDVSGARLLMINIERLYAVALGGGQSLKVTGDFEDQSNVPLIGDYLDFVVDHPTVASVDSLGWIRGVGAGSAVLRASARGIEGVNAFTVATDPTRPRMTENGVEVDAYPGAIVLPTGGQRQLKVTEPDHTNISAASAGTRYFINDPSIAEITAGGLVIAKSEGRARVAVINGGRQHDIVLTVRAPIMGSAQVTAENGAIVADGAGNILMAAPGALPDGTSISIRALAIDQVGINLPAPEALVALGAVEIDLDGAKADLPLQLAVRPAVTGLDPGTQVHFWRKGSIQDIDGSVHDTWWLVDNGIIGVDGIARTSSPPYSGITGGDGVFVITRGKIVDNNTGELKVTASVLNYNAFWAQQAMIAMAPSPYMAITAIGIFATLASPVAAISYTLEGSYKRDIAKTDLDLAKITTTFPDVPPATAHIPYISAWEYDASTRKLKVTGGNFIPPGQAPGNFDLRLWLRPRGEQLAAPTPNGTAPDRGLVWQAFETRALGHSGLEIDLPEGIALSMHYLYIERIAMSRTTEGRVYSSLPSDSDPAQAWTLGTDDTLLTTSRSIEVLRAERQTNTSTNATTATSLSLVSSERTDERGQPLELHGRFTDQIAHSNDGTLAFIAGAKGKIYVFDTLTRRVVHTLSVVNSTTTLTSLAVDNDWLYATEGNYFGASGGRLIRINIGQNSQGFLIEQQVVQFGADAPYGFQDMAINNGTYMALTAPINVGSVFNRGSEGPGNVYIIDLGKIDRNGRLKAGAMVKLTGTSFPVANNGKWPHYVGSGQADGEFLLSSAKTPDQGVVSLKISLDTNGNLTGSVSGTGIELTPAADNSLWRRQQFQQNIQRASDSVIVEYQGTEYALVADYNFDFNDPSWGTQSMYRKQIGGKIGIIQDPFGKAGGPLYLGATTPILGGAVEHLAIAIDARGQGALFADVWIDEEIPGGWQCYKSLFVWDANTLIQSALIARANGQKTITPIDRIQGVEGAAGQVPGALPRRYDGVVAGEHLGWTYGIGSYSVPGRVDRLAEVNVLYPVIPNISATGPTSPTQPSIDDNLTTRFMGITDDDVAAQIAAGNTSALSAAWYASKVTIYTGWNFMLGGFVQSQAHRTEDLSSGKLTKTQFLTATGTGVGYSVLGLAAGARVGTAVSNAVGHSAWGKFGGYLAEDITYTLFSKGGELVTYAATAGKAGTSVEQLRQEYAPITTDVLLNSGIVFLGHMIGKAPIFNHQVIWNSPTVANPLRYRIAEPILASDPRGLRYTLADSTGGAVMSLAGGKISYKGHVIELPTHGSLTLDEAHAWIEQAGTQLKHFLNDQVSLQDQAKQAIDISNAIVAAGRNAMENANAAAQLNFTKPLFTYDQWLNRLGSEKGGNPLYKAIIEAAESQTKHPGEACFVAGTLVHTKDGLKPIEQIQVGDYVLSKPESGVGELSYQRVVKTFVHEDQPVLCVDVYSQSIFDQVVAQETGKYSSSGNAFPLVVTPNHPFWVLNKGWTKAQELRRGVDVLILPDGSQHRVYDVSIVIRTVNPDVGFLICGRDCPIKYTETTSRAVYFRGSQIRTSYRHEDDIENEEIEWWELYDSDRLRRKVYNIEVEYTHTYFVGEKGVWVHNKQLLLGEAEELALQEARNYILPPGGTRAFYIEGQARAAFTQKVRPEDGSQRQGVIMVAQKANEPLKNNQHFQLQTEGSLFFKADNKNNYPDDLILEFSYVYQNPLTRGRDFIKSGDGRAKIYELDNKTLDVPIYSKTTIDAKYEKGMYEMILDSISTIGQRIQIKTVESLSKTTAALQQNPGYSHVIEIEDAEGVLKLVQFLKNAVGDPKWDNGPATGIVPGWVQDDWFSDKIYLALAQKPTLQPDGALRRILPETLIGFKKITTPDGKVIGLEVIGDIKEIRDESGKLIDLAIDGGVKKKDVLVPANTHDAASYFKDIVNIARIITDKFQLVDRQVTPQDMVAPEQHSINPESHLKYTDLHPIFESATDYWLQQGVARATLHDITYGIEALPDNALALARGNHIVFSPIAAGYGWFIDPTPLENQEFSQLAGSQEYQANEDSQAVGKIDLLSVMIHELGHVLGLEHSADSQDEMTAIMSPGLRRLPDLDADQSAMDFGIAMTAAPRTAPTNGTAISDYQISANPTLTNPAFNGATGWTTLGDVRFASPTATLTESPAAQTRLNQVFVLGAGARYLSFTLDGLALDDNVAASGRINGPKDAFEVALIDANTGRSLFGGNGLAGSDAFLNLQANGGVHTAAGVGVTANPDGSRTVQVDLSGIAAGTVANLSFDLIGFGRGAAAASSHVGVRDLRLDLPLRAGDDSAASAEDSPVEIDVLGNDQGVAAGVVPVPVAGPAHGTLSVTADNRLRYTPDANWHGADSFTYKLSDGVSESNVATVSVTVSPANDAPGAAGAAYTLAQGGSQLIDLVGRVATDGAVSGLGRRQVEDRVVPCVASKISRR